MRKILFLLGGLVVLLLAVAIYFVVNLDAVVKSRIERTGTRIAEVPVTVGSVDISLAKGTATVRDLRIANPPGFSAEPAMHFAEISAEVDISTLDISRVTTRSPVIRVEGTPERTNIDVLRRTVAPPRRSSAVSDEDDDTERQPRVADTEGGDDSAAEADEEDAEESPTTYRIHLLEIEQAGAVVDLEGMDSPVELTIDRLAFSDLAGTRSDITRKVLEQLTERIMEAVRERLTDVAREAVRTELERRADELEQKAREKLKSLFD